MGSKTAVSNIITEKNHIISCYHCEDYINTWDSSHFLTKQEAYSHFLSQGWTYQKSIGWCCPEHSNKK